MKESDPGFGTREFRKNRSAFKRYSFAVVVGMAAFFIRFYLRDAILIPPDKHAFTACIIATIIVAWYSGYAPALLVLVLGFTMADYWFVAPVKTFGPFDRHHFDMLIPAIMVGLTIVAFARSLHAARENADDHATQAINDRKKLEAEAIERKLAEKEVRRLNEELEQRVELRTAELVSSNQELESFTYSVSHDLRAPLRHVDGYAQILEEEYGPQLPEEAQQFTKKIRQGSQNMGRLVDDLLNLSRVGKAELGRQRVALKPLVEESAAEIKLEDPRRNVDWEIGDLGTVECDPGLIRLVFANLLSNAFKYSRPAAHARIEVSEKQIEGETVFFVRDNGVGFDMKYAGKLFGVFQRLHRAEEFEGTGVGLATVARIIRKHGGRIWAEGHVDKGATFFFTLSPPPMRH